MTTHHHPVSLVGRQHETSKVVWTAIGIVASALCAVAMIGNVTWAEEANWFLFALAGFGVPRSGRPLAQGPMPVVGVASVR
jgi:hypothetical protein